MRLFVLIAASVGMTLSLHAQSPDTLQIKKEMERIRSAEKARDFVRTHEQLKSRVVEIIDKNDSSVLAQNIFAAKMGVVQRYTAHGKRIYFKVLENESYKAYRVRYVFFDGSRLPLRKIDSVRAIIHEEVKKGTSFATLAKMYSMDGNAVRGGDTGWFREKQMVEDFALAVKGNRPGKTYDVNIPAQKWYYVNQNTHQPTVLKKRTVLIVEVDGEF